MIIELLEFEKAINVIVSWDKFRRDTLIIVTSDHETGGLTLQQNNEVGNIPDVSWSTTGHFKLYR